MKRNKWLFNTGKILAVASFGGIVYFLAYAGANISLNLAYVAVSVVGVGVGGLFVAIGDRAE